MRVKSAVLVILFFMGQEMVCPAQDKPKLEIAAFSIAKPNPASDFGEALSQFRSAGMELDVYFELPGRTVLSIDSRQSQVTLKADDGGEMPLKEQFDGLFRLNLREDRSSGTIVLQSEELPGKKSTKLNLNGTFVLNVGKGEKTEDVELKLTEGSKSKLGPVEVTISQVGEAFGDPFKQSIEFSAKKSLEAISKIEFLDGKGNVIESSSGGSGSFGFDDDITYSQSWQIASEAKSLKVRVSYFAETESIKLPAALEFGFGL